MCQSKRRKRLRYKHKSDRNSASFSEQDPRAQNVKSQPSSANNVEKN